MRSVMHMSISRANNVLRHNWFMSSKNVSPVPIMMRWILMTIVLLVASCEGIKLLARLSIMGGDQCQN